MRGLFTIFIREGVQNAIVHLYGAEGTRIAKGTIAAWSCDPSTNGFQITNSYILTPGNQQLTELTWSGNTPQWAHTNVWAAGQLLATYSADPDPTQNVAGILNFYIDDPLATRRVMTDFAGNIQETCHSLPYGNGEDCAAAPSEHLFTNKERDAETGNDYLGARYYASSMGRFLTPDWSAKVEPVPYSKLDDPQTLNLYAYVGNNPFIRLDADGHDCSMSSGGSTPECNASEKATAVEDYVFGQGGYAVGKRPGDSTQDAIGGDGVPSNRLTRDASGNLVYTHELYGGSFSTCDQCLHVSDPYGAPRDNGTTQHGGIDLATGGRKGINVLSQTDGTVIRVGASGFGPHSVTIQSPRGTFFTYGHLASNFVNVGSPIKAGMQLGEIGNLGHSTGIHVHIQASTGAPFGPTSRMLGIQFP